LRARAASTDAYAEYETPQELADAIVDTLSRLDSPPGASLAGDHDGLGPDSTEGQGKRVSIFAPFRGATPEVNPDLVLELAWRLVVERKKDPDLLGHLDPERFRAALHESEGDASRSKRLSWKTRLVDARRRLAARQEGLAPSALWTAWMKNVHAGKM
jgi:hypothetical protein